MNHQECDEPVRLRNLHLCFCILLLREKVTTEYLGILIRIEFTDPSISRTET